jgi:crotonobetainyl-CoA:carnitine CoA-transferase CaiB-like acyl-CoA transferase
MSQQLKGPLEGIVVLDLTQFLSGPFATMILADLGATVIKIERPDRPKASGPFLKGERIYDLSVQRSKKSVTMNLKSDKEKAVFLEMVKKADIVAENFKPGTMERMGLGYEDLKKINPRIIHLGISGFGATGPYRERGALDMVIQGMSGLMSLTGDPEGPPTRVGTSASDTFSGLYGFGAVMTALYHRERTGEGQTIDIAMLDSTFSCLENAVVNTCVSGKNPQRMGNRHSTSVPFQTFKTADGDIIITCSRDAAFYDLCRAIGREDMIEDPRFSKAEDRRLNIKMLEEEITAFTSKHTIAECEAALIKFNVPHGRINTMLMVCNDPQIAAREMVVEVEHPVAGKYRMAGSPIKMSATPKTYYAPAPLLGQHTRDILSSLGGLNKEQIDEILKDQDPLRKK